MTKQHIKVERVLTEEEPVANKHAGALNARDKDIALPDTVNVARVKEHLPSKSNKQTRYRDEEEPLETQPLSDERALHDHLVVQDRAVEGQQREGVEIHIVLQLLGGSVVTVVLGSPPLSRHSAASTVQESLQHAIDDGVGGHTVMATLMHQPSATALHDAKNDETKTEKDGVVSVGDEKVESDEMHNKNL